MYLDTYVHVSFQGDAFQMEFRIKIKQDYRLISKEQNQNGQYQNIPVNFVLEIGVCDKNGLNLCTLIGTCALHALYYTQKMHVYEEVDFVE